MWRRNSSAPGSNPRAPTGICSLSSFDVRKIVESQSSLELVRNGAVERLTLGEDAVVSLRVDPAEAVEAPLVFAGYGLVVPELKFDDLAGQDLKGKIIVIIQRWTVEHSRSAEIPLLVCDRAGQVPAAGRRGRHGDDSESAHDRYSLGALLAGAAAGIDEPDGPGARRHEEPEDRLTLNAAHADKWLAGSGHTVDELLALVDAGKPLPHFPLVPSMRAKVKVERRQVESENVVARFAGADPVLKNEHVVISAHLDHVGVGEPINGDRIYNGAMDNAAGVASMLEIAQQLRDSGARLKRSVLFVAVTGEEKGLLGSRYFAAHPTVEPNSMVGDVNLDMFLPLYPFKLVTTYGLNESDLGDTVRQVAQADAARGAGRSRARRATSSSAAISTTSFAAAFPP